MRSSLTKLFVPTENKEEFPGTTAWAAPEVLPPKHPKTAQEYTTAADVYSFGITLWEMVSNRRPFTGYRFEFEVRIVN